MIASGLNEDERVLAAATGLVGPGGAVRIVPAFADPAADMVAYGAALSRKVTPATLQRIQDQEHEALARLQALAEKAAQRDNAAVHCESRQLLPVAAAASAAALADLVLFASESVRERAALAGVFAEVLLAARAPTLVVSSAGVGNGKVMIAWDGSAEAGRAMRAALPLLSAAQSILIASNIEDLGEEAERAEPSRLISYLRAHGVRDAQTRTVRGQNIANSLLQAAKQDDCGLLVAGAYGRPRLYEFVLGGTTRALVNAEGAPSLLLAH
jgi:nucleotide-binding universal stress UspA family protein